MVYWENMKLNLEMFQDEKLAHPGETFQFALGVLNLQKDTFLKDIPFESYQGLLKIDSQ
jgi:dynein heavy chain